MELEAEGERLMTRSEIAAFLTERGYKVARATLAKYAVIGGGPEFQMFGRYPKYRPSKALEWAEARLTKPVRSRSELQGASAAA